MRERIVQRVRRALGVEARERELATLREELARANAETARLEAEARGRAEATGEWRAEVAGRLATLELRASIAPAMASIARATLAAEPLVSVVTPTLGREAVLARAIDSVLAQTYSNWELVLVADDEGRAAAERVDDPRIRTTAHRGPGVCAARNTALEVASGDLIAYLDDDNVMDPGWLRTVVWAFETRPDADVIYGAYVIDDVERLNSALGGGLPGLVLNRFDREGLLTGNPADVSAIAHRAGLPEARFDESLVQAGDWELLARLVADKDPFVVPAIACYYGTDADGRLSLEPPSAAELDAVKRACGEERTGAESRRR
jgi:hypothetical protein